MAFESNCPACGAAITFKSGSSVVVVCEFCNSVVARTDRALEDLGKVADVVESGSPLEVGLRGVYRGTAFELTGRAQLGHAAGGMWDEWYAAFADGRWGWLAEAQGKFYLTYQAPDSIRVPSFEELELGRAVAGIPVNVPLVAAEKGEARRLAAEGEIPYRLVPGETFAYADLSGHGGTFATIDYGAETPTVYVGRETTLQELGVAETQRVRERAAQRVAVGQLSCPQCAGPLELRAPDKTERVTCPNCGSLLDVNQGRLQFLKALNAQKFKPTIPLGSQLDLDLLKPEVSFDMGGKNGSGDNVAAAQTGGQMAGSWEATSSSSKQQPTMVQGDGGARRKMTVIGFMVRSVEFDGVRYFWEEFLLYNPSIGFRWLVQSDNHWSFVETVAPGEATENSSGGAQFRGKTFKIFQDAAARVEHVGGEFYWKVMVGELARAVDYVSPPYMLSKETSGVHVAGQQRQANALQAEEINWSHGTYVPRKKIAGAFNLTLPSASNVAPNQPFKHKGIYKYWLLLMLAAIVVGVGTYATARRARVFEQEYRMPDAPQRPGGFDFSALTRPTPPQLRSTTNATGARSGARRNAAASQTPPSMPSPAAPTPTPLSQIGAWSPLGYDGTHAVFTEPFELKGGENILVSGTSNVDNNWLYVEGDLINEETGLVQQFSLPMERYYGTDGGESWSEGSKDESTYLSSLPAGKYTMRLEAQWEKWKGTEPPQFTVRVEQGVPRILNFILVLVALSILPVLVMIYQFNFERRRWADSAFNPYQSGDDSGGDDGGSDD